MRCAWLCATGAVLGCGGGGSSSDAGTADTGMPDTGTPDTETRDAEMPDTGALDTGLPDPGPHSLTLAATSDTFINSGNPDNNNGASLSIYAGVDGHGGVMRGLILFTLPMELRGLATVTSVELKMTLRAFGNGTPGPEVVESLHAIGESWTQGNGSGDATSTFTVGERCDDPVTGATWNAPNCANGAGGWVLPGGTVAATASGQADTTGVGLGGQVVWSSTAPGNAAMLTDVQSWLDAPSGNDGWRISSSDETTPSTGKRFYSTEAGGAVVPTLTIVYTQ
jgi:hypothetical protein